MRRVRVKKVAPVGGLVCTRAGYYLTLMLSSVDRKKEKKIIPILYYLDRLFSDG